MFPLCPLWWEFLAVEFCQMLFVFFLHLLRQFCDFNPSFLNVFYHSDLLVSTFKNIYLFMAVLGLSRCAWAFSGCREHELLSSSGRQASHWGDFSCSESRLYDKLTSVVVACVLSICGLQALDDWLSNGLRCPAAREIFLDQGLTSVPCIAKWIINH